MNSLASKSLCCSVCLLVLKDANMSGSQFNVNRLSLFTFFSYGVLKILGRYLMMLHVKPKHRYKKIAIYNFNFAGSLIDWFYSESSLINIAHASTNPCENFFRHLTNHLDLMLTDMFVRLKFLKLSQFSFSTSLTFYVTILQMDNVINTYCGSLCNMFVSNHV